MAQPASEQSLILPATVGPVHFRHCRHGLMGFLAADDVIGRCLDVYGEFAESENQLMSCLLRPGDVALDAGANVGTVTLPLARCVGPQGLVLAFEPLRFLFQTLCATLALNGLLNVRVFHAALGQQGGKIRVPTLDPYQPANFGATRLGPQDTGEIVDLLTIDALELTRCQLLKIDVEGMDCQVLLGAVGTIERTWSFVYVEAKKGSATSQAIAWLQERRYQCYWHFAPFCSPDNYRQAAENLFPGVGDINLLALPTEKGIQVRLPLIHTPDSDWQRDYHDFMTQRAGKS